MKNKAVSWQLACVLIVTIAGRNAAAQDAGAVQVSVQRELRTALERPGVTDILLLQDLKLSDSVWKVEEAIVLSRNVTLRGNKGGAYAELDFNYVKSKVRLVPGAALTLERLMVKHIHPPTLLSAQILDFLALSPGAFLILRNVDWLRSICAPPNWLLPVVRTLPRGPSCPVGVQTGSDESGSTFCSGGICTNELFVLVDYCPRPFIPTGADDLGGYTIYMTNVSIFCDSLLSQACINQSGAAACLAQQVDELGRPQNSTPIAAIVAPVVLGSVLIFAAIAGLLVFKRRRRHQENLAALAAAAAAAADAEAKPEEDRTEDYGPLANLHRAEKLFGPKGWLLQPPHVVIKKYLGHGGFGTVWLGSLDGKEVAIKVVRHSGGASDTVLNEVSCIQGLRHPNIVQTKSYLVVYLPAKGSKFSSGSMPSLGHDRSTVMGPPSDPASKIRVLERGPLRVSPPKTSSDTRSKSQQSTAQTSTAQQSTAQYASTSQLTNPSTQHRRVSPPASASQTASAAQLVSSSQVSSPLQATPGRLERFSIGSSDQDGLAPDMLSLIDSEAGAPCETLLFMEYCNGGGLAQELRLRQSTGQPLSLPFQLSLCIDVARGIEYLHKCRLVHGDLKADNILLVYRQDEEWPIGKVSDFGLSRSMTASHLSTRTMGTVSHTAPEQLIYGRMGPEADIYALGLLMWEITSGGEVPHKGCNHAEIVYRVAHSKLRPVFKPDVLPAYVKLAEECWAHEPAERPSVAQVLKQLEALAVEAELKIHGEILSHSGGHMGAAPDTGTSFDTASR